MPNQGLPVWQLHDEIVRNLTAGNQLVLVAATGSGKTTQVPQMLLDAGVSRGKRIVILQPRRVAARTVAARVAWERGGRLGGEVGYQVRFEEHLSEASRLCFVTEGILLRGLQNDHALRDVGVVMFDEFHERNLLSDVALALVKRLQQTTRPDLKIVVMSATLEAEPVARYLAEDPESAAPILVSEGRTFPVAIHWAEYVSVPALASFAIFQFLWVWNDYLVALIFLGDKNRVVTSALAAMVGEKGQDWHYLTSGAFLSMILPLAVFFALQRYFVRGLLAGSVKG